MAKIRNGADLSKYGEAGAERVLNTSSYTITNESGEQVKTDSNTVTVTPSNPENPTPPAKDEAQKPTPPTVKKSLAKTGDAAGMLAAAMMTLLVGAGVTLVRLRKE